MLRRARLIAAKDLSLSLAGGQGVVQAILLGLLLIFLFSLSRPVGDVISGQAAGTIFWLASAFGLILIFNDLFSVEEVNGARLGLISSPVPLHAIWLGKAITGFILLVLTQVVFLPAAIAFLGQSISGSVPLLFGTLLAADVGLVVVGSLLGALSQGQGARESLLSVIVFPLLLPVLLAGITLFGIAFSGQQGAEAIRWFSIIAAFDAVFAGAALLLFPFVYDGEE